MKTSTQSEAVKMAESFMANPYIVSRLQRFDRQPTEAEIVNAVIEGLDEERRMLERMHLAMVCPNHDESINEVLDSMRNTTYKQIRRAA
jgi:predicted transcriptional regulator